MTANPIQPIEEVSSIIDSNLVHSYTDFPWTSNYQFRGEAESIGHAIA